MNLVHRLFWTVALCALCATVAGCSKQSSSGKKYEDYPAFTEGGKIDLTMDGQPYTIRLNDIQFVNTDEGYADYVEINGPKTRILVECKKELGLDFDTDTVYDPIVNAPLPVGTMGADDEHLTLNVPDLGVFDVSGGSLELLKYQIGRDGRDHWDGKITLTIETDQGQKSLPGSFSWCIVPVW